MPTLEGMIDSPAPSLRKIRRLATGLLVVIGWSLCAREIVWHVFSRQNAGRRLRWVVQRLPDLMSQSDRRHLARLEASAIRHGAATGPMARFF